jgi:PAS domain S-box-containing protein
MPRDTAERQPALATAATRAAWTALLYGLAGLAALELAPAPGFASPLYPAAGIALACVLAWGAPALAGVWLGAVGVNGWAVMHAAAPSTPSVLAALPWLALSGVGAALQAWAGVGLLRRWVGAEPVLQRFGEIVRAGLAGALSCTLSASFGAASLAWTVRLPLESWPTVWTLWWLGDLAGVLVAAPVTLAFIGRPREEWRPRRAALALPMLLALGVMAAAMLLVGHAERTRQAAALDRDAERLTGTVRTRLDEPLHALQALHGVARARAPAFDATALEAAARWWLQQPVPLRALGFSPWVPLGQLDAFVSQARAEGADGFRVFDRDDGSARRAAGAVVALRHILPLAGNQAAVGVNVLSIPAAREAILRSRRTGQPVASAAFGLTQSASDETGVVIYQAVYDGSPDDEVSREAAFRGVVFVTLATGQLLAPEPTRAGVDLQACLVDTAPGVQRPRLAGLPGCEHAPSAGSMERLLRLADRPLQLRITRPDAAARSPDNPWLVGLAMAGVASLAALCALLLAVTGQGRLTERAVQDATAQLRRQAGERERADEALRASEERLRRVLDNVPIGVIATDLRGRMTTANPQFARIVGRALGELPGIPVTEFTEAATVPVILRHRQALLEGAESVGPDQIGMQMAGGRVLQARLTSSALRDPGGRVSALVGVVEDISEHLELQASELRRQRAEASSRAKSEFLSRMSHELRTPLNAMIGFAQVMGLDPQAPLVPAQLERLQHIQKAGWHLLELINETLDLSRIEAGQVALNPARVSMLVEVQAVVAMLAPVAGRMDVAITVAPGLEGLQAQCDATRLRQVLTNLLSNAIKYNRRGGHVEVSAQAAGSEVELCVADDGLGMSEQQLADLFQPYNRLGRETSGVEGTGIGLVISRRLAELMGGSLHARSRPGLGSVFALRLPAAAPTPPSAPAAVADEWVPSAVRRLLYIEDNQTNIEVMRGVLSARPSYQMHEATTGEAGWAALRALRPDLLLLDMGLPDLDGLELLARIEADDDLARIPVIVVSADASPQRVELALTRGARSYVTKPFAAAAFLELVDRTLEAVDTQW